MQDFCHLLPIPAYNVMEGILDIPGCYLFDLEPDNPNM